MADLQELITRGKFIFSGAPKRLEVFKCINGQRSTKDVSRMTRRSLSTVLHDIEKLADMELIRTRKDNFGKVLKKNNATIYEKMPLVKHIPLSYFASIADTTKYTKTSVSKKTKRSHAQRIHTPTEQEILDISKAGEDQYFEFKSPGTDTSKITKEIAAFLHTKNGGIIFYGIEDDGSIVGSDVTRQVFDQRIHNSVRNTVSPQPTVIIKERNVIGSTIILVIIPPWNRKNLYQYSKTEKYYIRRGSNVFALKPDELQKLSKGQFIV